MENEEGDTALATPEDPVVEGGDDVEHGAIKERVLERQRQKAESPSAEEQAVPLKELQDNGPTLAATGPMSEIDLNALVEVQVALSVEIGRTRMPIKQLISLTQGSVIELDRSVNEPLDLLVNGTLIARGEVVVVDGKFGLRLIDIVSQSERLRKIK